MASVDFVDIQIEIARNNKAGLYSVFFDLENAYHRVWKHYICKSVQAAGLSGPLSWLLQSYLVETASAAIFHPPTPKLMEYLKALP